MQSQGESLWLDTPFPPGQLLSFDIGDQPVFEIPLSNVSQCTTGKNEVTLEFHQNDDAEVSLMEVRFYVPPTQEDGVDPVEVRPSPVALGAGGVEQAPDSPGVGSLLLDYQCVLLQAFAQNVLSKADVIDRGGAPSLLPSKPPPAARRARRHITCFPLRFREVPTFPREITHPSPRGSSHSRPQYHAGPQYLFLTARGEARSPSPLCRPENLFKYVWKVLHVLSFGEHW